MHKAKLPGGSQGKEDEIRISFYEEVDNGPHVELHFNGAEVMLISDHEGMPNDWNMDNLENIFSIALHRVLPQAGQLVWERI